MNKYLILYRGEIPTGVTVTELFANTPPEQLEAGLKMWSAWYDKCGSAIVDRGTPLDSSTIVSGGASAPNITPTMGYTILQAGSLEEAVALMKDHPHFYAPGASVEILECVRLPGM